jgi:transposase
MIYKGLFMKLSITESKNSKSLYVTKSIYVDGKRTSRVVKKLGTYKELYEKLDGKDPIVWAREHIKQLTIEEKEMNKKVIVQYSPIKSIDYNQDCLYNGGYLFLQSLYYDLKLDKICKDISNKYKFSYDLNSILSRLLYSRIIYPSSKLETNKLSKRFIEEPNFSLQNIYRALEVIAKETEFIQERVYKNSILSNKRRTGILYYDCTNYFFEIEHPDGIKQFGYGKDHKPNPIVQMGLFMDIDGMPLAFDITHGNQNEQLTMTPIEKRIIRDYKLSKFVVCTDSGLSSIVNRKFNNICNRSFITTQSIKKLKGFLMDWALDENGWKLSENSKTYNIKDITNKDLTYYKQRWIVENGLEQKLIVTYSLKYKEYQRQIRLNQIERLEKTLNTNPSKINKKNQNDYRRFANKKSVTKSGEVAKKHIYTLDEKLIEKEQKFDGFYGICTNLEDEPLDIIKVNHRRWQIEECFRIMKTDFKARPVYLRNDDRIKAHFTTCFLSLLLYRLLENKLDKEFTCSEIIKKLKDMNFYKIKGEGYVPTYSKDTLTDKLHESFNFRTDYQINTLAKMRKIIKLTKS